MHSTYIRPAFFCLLATLLGAPVCREGKTPDQEIRYATVMPREATAAVGSTFSILWDEQPSDLYEDRDDGIYMKPERIPGATDGTIVAFVDSDGTMDRVRDAYWTFNFECLKVGTTRIELRWLLYDNDDSDREKLLLDTVNIPVTCVEPDEDFICSDPSGDQDCPDDPMTEFAPPALDLLGFSLQEVGDTVVATTMVVGNPQEYNEGLGAGENFPFSLQFWLNDDTYIEVFYSTGNVIKVADGKIDVVSDEIDVDRLVVTLRRLNLREVKKVTVQTYAFGYPNYDGACSDECTIEH